MAKDYVEILNDGRGDRYVRDAEAQAGIAQVASAIGTDADYEFADLGLPSGTIWAKCNVGATLETNYGNYYKYGKGSAQYDSSQADYTGTENPLAAAADTATQVMGAPWHMPTREQFEELVANTTYTWETNFNGSGVKGSKFTAANGNYVFFPAAGDIREGSTENVNVQGRYWSSTPSESSGGAYAILMYSGGTVTSNAYYRYFGYSVRGVASSLDLLTDVKGELNNRYTKSEVDALVSDVDKRFMVSVSGKVLTFTNSPVRVQSRVLILD